MKIVAELVSVSPIKFNVTEEWKFRKDGHVEKDPAEWIFSEQ